MLYWWIKDNHYLECDHATKEYQMFTDSCQVHYWNYNYFIKHTSVEYFYDIGEEDTNEVFISRIKTDDWLEDNREDVYYCKYHNRSVDRIQLATDFIENDYKLPEEDDWWVF